MRPKIILVEDNPGDVALYRLAFEAIPNPPDLCILNDGEAALSFFEDQRNISNLLLLDLNLPKVTGHEVLRRIRESAYMDDMPIVIISSSESKAEIERCYETGANCYITKPQGLKQLKDVLQKVMQFWIYNCTQFQTV